MLTHAVSTPIPDATTHRRTHRLDTFHPRLPSHILGIPNLEFKQPSTMRAIASDDFNVTLTPEVPLLNHRQLRMLQILRSKECTMADLAEEIGTQAEQSLLRLKPKKPDPDQARGM